jgi:hypothetical protein
MEALHRWRVRRSCETLVAAHADLDELGNSNNIVSTLASVLPAASPAAFSGKRR